MSRRMFGTVSIVGALLAGIGGLVALLLASGPGATTAGAHVVLPPEYFPGYTCRASALRLGEQPDQPKPWEPELANRRNNPCIRDAQYWLSGRRQAKNGIVTEGVVAARTEGSHKQQFVRAHSEIADIRIRNMGVDDVQVAGIVSNARVDCVKGAPEISGNSRIAQLTIPGLTIPLFEAPSKISLGPIVLWLNRQIRTKTANGEAITVRALELETGDETQHLTLAESRAGFRGNPCVA